MSHALFAIAAFLTLLAVYTGFLLVVAMLSSYSLMRRSARRTYADAAFFMFAVGMVVFSIVGAWRGW